MTSTGLLRSRVRLKPQARFWRQAASVTGWLSLTPTRCDRCSVSIHVPLFNHPFGLRKSPELQQRGDRCAKTKGLSWGLGMAHFSELAAFWRRVMHFFAWVLVGCFSFMGLVCAFSGQPGGSYYAGVCFMLVAALCPVLPLVWWSRALLVFVGLVLG